MSPVMPPPDKATLARRDEIVAALRAIVQGEGVNCLHLVDPARAYVEQRHRRPLRERTIRAMPARVPPRPGRFRATSRLARLAKGAAPLLGRSKVLEPVAAMLAPAGLTSYRKGDMK